MVPLFCIITLSEYQNIRFIIESDNYDISFVLYHIIGAW